MNTDFHSEPRITELPPAASADARRASDSTKETANEASGPARDISVVLDDAAHDVAAAARRAADSAREGCHVAAARAGDALETSKEYVRRNPVPVVLGAIVFGVTVGYLLATSRRPATFGERYADEPLSAIREAVMGALAPVTHRLHDGYDAARDGAGKMVDRVHNYKPGRTCASVSDKLGRIGSNLRFW